MCVNLTWTFKNAMITKCFICLDVTNFYTVHCLFKPITVWVCVWCQCMCLSLLSYCLCLYISNMHIYGLNFFLKLVSMCAYSVAWMLSNETGFQEWGRVCIICDMIFSYLMITKLFWALVNIVCIICSGVVFCI